MRLSSFRFVVDGLSMAPLLADGDALLVVHLHYQFIDPSQGDVVVLNAPTGHGNQRYVKRIVGLPGDTVVLREGQLYINNVVQHEPYLSVVCSHANCANSIWVLGQDDYFVLGDNRNASRDSRAFGAITRDLIIGQAVVRYWPIQHLSWVH